MRKRRNEGITLIALIVTIIVLLILAGVSIAMLTGENGILTQAQNAKNEMTKKEAEERIKLEVLGSYGTDGKIDIATLKANIAKNIQEAVIGEETDFPLTVTLEGYTFTITENGEVKEVGGSGTVTPTPTPAISIRGANGANHPELKEGMTAITYNLDGTENTVTDTTKTDWYNYAEQTGLTNTYNEETGEWGTSHWANAKLNGNYYVWIPRYAYKIDKSVSYTSQSGTSYKIDVIFLDENNKKADGTEIEGLITNYAEVNDTKNATTNYVLHPAFTFGEDKLSGIWVGKYETSGTATNPTILPNQVAATKSTISDLNVAKMFDMAQNVLTSDTQKAELDAHMIKNTEWGAVAYLAQSQYGRNGTEISVNQCTGKITGAGRGIGTETDNPIYNSTYAVNTTTNLPEADQQYNGKIGKLSSTTGNIYGVYDMSGGVFEYVMGFYGTKADDGTETLGYSGFTAKPENKYYNLYTSTSANNTNIGDALYETKGWNGDSSSFVGSAYPVFLRGGGYGSTGYAGAFRFNAGTGTANDSDGSRVCIAVK